MSHFVQLGNVLTLIAPVGGAKTGVGYIHDQIFAVATGGGVDAGTGADTVPENSPYQGQVIGVLSLSKVTAQAWTIGQAIFWDDTAKLATTAVADLYIGYATEVADNPSSLGDVRLNASGLAPAASTNPFVSTEQTGTGAPQNIAHGLGATPGNVVVNATDLAPATTGDFTVAEGVHDATNVILTVTLDKKFKVTAYR